MAVSQHAKIRAEGLPENIHGQRTNWKFQSYRIRTKSPVRANTPVPDPHVFSHHFAVIMAGKISVR